MLDKFNEACEKPVDVWDLGILLSAFTTESSLLATLMVIIFFGRTYFWTKEKQENESE